MEGIRYYDLVITSRYFDALLKKRSTETAKANAQSCSVAGSVNPIPVMPILLNESQALGLEQNPGYQSNYFTICKKGQVVSA